MDWIREGEEVKGLADSRNLISSRELREAARQATAMYPSIHPSTFISVK